MRRLSFFLSAVICGGFLITTGAPMASPRSFQVKRQIIHTAEAPSQSPLYSQAIKVGSTIYVTGTLGIDPKTNQPAGLTIQEQTRQALINCQNILRAAGAELENVVEVQVLLARPNDFAGLNEEYAKFFPTDPPTRSVARLGPELPNFLISVRMTAVL
jgi:reactive intermediate/imine deaminase